MVHRRSTTTEAPSDSASMSEGREGVLKLMCLVWNETHRRHDDEFLALLNEEFDVTESVTWDEMRERLEKEDECVREKGVTFASTAGMTAYASVPSTILQVVCMEDLDEEQTADVKQKAKCEKDELDKMEKICEGTQLQIPLSLVEKLKPRVKLVRYPSGYQPTTRTMILESVTVFNLNDVHPAFYKLGHRLADIKEDQELHLFLQRVQEERFEQLIQFIANEEDVAETGFSPETAENFLSEEEKEILREWKADIASMHSIESAYSSVEKEFKEQYGIMDA